MKIIVAFLSMAFLISVPGICQERPQVDSASFSRIEKSVAGLQSDIDALKANISIISSQISSIQTSVSNQNQVQKTLTEDLVMTKAGVEANSSNIASTSEHLQIKISEANSLVNEKTGELSAALNSRTVILTLLAVVLFLIIVIVFIFLRSKIKRGSSIIEKVQTAQKSLQEEGVKLDEKLLSLLDSKLSTLGTRDQSQVPDHSLALKVADEIIRIETNLSRMDPSIKGYKQLSSSVKRIKENFAANGYEIVDMLGKSYNDGIKCSVNFVTDESLKDGEQVITGIIKPQINYNGKMIQAAQITVSQNN